MKVIINADDYGWDDETNEAICKLLSQNSIHSTTILANFATKDSLVQLRQYPNISTGIHFNLTEGRALSKKEDIYSLTDTDNNFYPLHILLLRCIFGLIKREHVLTELKTQISFLKDNNIEISHLDGHQHVHYFPIVSSVVAKYAKPLGIRKIRSIYVYPANNLRMKFLKVLHFFGHKKFNQYIMPDILLSSDFIIKNDNINKDFHCIEIMAHPRTQNTEKCYLNRAQEFENLSNNVVDYKLSKYKKCSYWELNE
ncbi:carbohydrate deacetylase [Halobacteriovorax sp.]|uniref:carbohydrate deacetylase n=1 Tax=Halobacteriovorax sp. TaxID=2020862 RepID=UPI003AF2BDD6